MDEVEELIRFLNGEGPLDGVWFGDAITARPRFWWRERLSVLTEALTVSPEKLEAAGRRLNEVYQRYGQIGDLRTSPLSDGCAIALARAAAIALGMKVE